MALERGLRGQVLAVISDVSLQHGDETVLQLWNFLNGPRAEGCVPKYRGAVVGGGFG